MTGHRIARVLGVFVTLLVCAAVCWPVADAAGRDAKRTPKRPARPDPVLLVHGFGGSGSHWGAFRDRLLAAGYRDEEVVAMSYDSNQPIPAIADDVQSAADALLARTKRKRLDIVSHSMGALVSRYYVDVLGGDAQVDAWVSLGGANQGTHWATECLPVLSCVDMLPGSETLNELARAFDGDGPVRYGTWWSPCDVIIVPAEFAQLPGARNTETACLDHGAVVTDPVVFAQVERFLRREAPASLLTRVDPRQTAVVQVGVSLRSRFSTDARTGARWMVERAEAAAAAGLASLFVGDHHSTAPEVYYQNVPIVGRLLAVWDHRPAGALFLLPLWHPVLLAEQVGTLAALAGGPFVVQTAIGGGRAQFDALGVPLRARASRFELALDALRRLLAGEAVSDPDGACGYRFAEAHIAPVPSEPVRVWIGASAPAAIDRAARLGDGWVCNADILPADAAEQAAIHAAAVAAHGVDRGVVAIRRDVHVGRDAGDAAAVAEPVIAGGYRGFRPEAFIWGSVEQVAEQFRALAAVGFTAVIVRQLAAEQADALASIELLGEVARLVADA